MSPPPASNFLSLTMEDHDAPQRAKLRAAGGRSIIEAHGGRLWASANVPRGAIFQFTLPTYHVQ
jgi:K+-sensing histidine kinase KdpD